MKRQQTRKLILILSFLLFPITLFYFSPAVPIEGAINGIITGSLIVFSLQLITSVFVGRLFCGWLCPGGGLQEICMLVAKKSAKNGKLNWIKYVIWVTWITILVSIFVKSGNPIKMNFLFATQHGISVADPLQYIIYYIVVGVIVILALLFGRRAFCHYGCWMAPFMVIGIQIKKLLNIPSLHIAQTEDNCKNCKKCNQVCPMSLDVASMVQKGNMFDTECILCGECIESCPTKAIQYQFGKSKKEGKTVKI